MVKLLDFVSFPNSTIRLSNSDLFIDCTDSLYNGLTITYLPVKNFGDGNCFAQAISQFLYGTENHHLEVRIRIVLEAVRNKHLYLDQDFLSKGLLQTPD